MQMKIMIQLVCFIMLFYYIMAMELKKMIKRQLYISKNLLIMELLAQCLTMEFFFKMESDVKRIQRVVV